MNSFEPPTPPPPPPPNGPPAPPPAWGPPPPGVPYPGAPYVDMGTPGKATASLVLGIVGLLVCPLICSVLAIIFGAQAKAEIDRTPGRSGRGVAQAGFVLGIVGAALVVVAVIVVLASSSS